MYRCTGLGVTRFRIWGGLRVWGFGGGSGDSGLGFEGFLIPGVSSSARAG